MPLKPISSYISTASFLLDNIIHARKLVKIQKKQIESKSLELYQLDCYRKGDLKTIRSIHRKCLNSDITNSNRVLIQILGHKLCYLIRDNSQRVIACILFYFDKRDIQEETIHLSSIIVSEEKHGCGLGSLLVKYSIENLRGIKGLMGVSSRVSLNNKASLKVHTNSNFKIKEEYYDTELQEMRVYLVLKLNNCEERAEKT